jgi:hypothetical protein
MASSNLEAQVHFATALEFATSLELAIMLEPPVTPEGDSEAPLAQCCG